MTDSAATFDLTQIDHTVINTRYDMDNAQQRFASLGFLLTERGYHTLGSINHLMMFGTDYLELIGLPTNTDGKPAQRPGISDAPVGINGLVFKTRDADASFAHLQSVGLAGDPPNSFSRPVQLATGAQDASFRTVHARRDAFAAGRVYFCEHQTPELVWQPQWQQHENQSLAIAEVVVVSELPREQAEKFANLLNMPLSMIGTDQDVSSQYVVPYSDGQLTIMSPTVYTNRFGSLASPSAGRADFFGALVFRCDSLSWVSSLPALDGLSHQSTANSVVIHDQVFDTVLEFVGA
ncbi:MAG: VOC family protein [Burkholderiaceae bacterium]